MPCTKADLAGVVALPDSLWAQPTITGSTLTIGHKKIINNGLPSHVLVVRKYVSIVCDYYVFFMFYFIYLFINFCASLLS